MKQLTTYITEKFKITNKLGTQHIEDNKKFDLVTSKFIIDSSYNEIDFNGDMGVIYDMFTEWADPDDKFDRSKRIQDFCENFDNLLAEIEKKYVVGDTAFWSEAPDNYPKELQKIFIDYWDSGFNLGAWIQYAETNKYVVICVGDKTAIAHCVFEINKTK